MSQLGVYKPNRSTAGDRSIWSLVFGYVLVFIAPMIAMAPLFHAGFTSLDDPATIVRNPHLNPASADSLGHLWTHSAGHLYVPITYTAWWAMASIVHDLSPKGAPLDPAPFHAMNVILHAMSSLLAAAIVRRLLRNDWAAILGGLIFALHPLQVEAVGWASGTKDLLGGLFGLLSIWLYLLQSPDTDSRVLTSMESGRERTFLQQVAYIFSLFFFLLAVLSKPTAMTIPAMLLVIDRLLFHRDYRSIAKSLGLFAAISLATMTIAWLAQPALRAVPAPLWMRPLMVGDALSFYGIKLIAPINLVACYGRTVKFLTTDSWLYIAWIIPVTVALALFILRKRAPLLAIGGAIFVIAISPTLGLFRFDYQYYSTVADHYVYFAMLGVAIAAGAIFKSHKAARFAACGFASGFAILSFHQSHFWKSDEALFTHSVDVAPDGLLALHNLGNVRQTQGRPDDAMRLFQHAVDIEPNHFESRGTLATLLARTGRMDLAVPMFETFLQQAEAHPEIMPPIEFAPYARAFAGTMLSLGNREKAIEYFKKAIAADRNDGDAMKGLHRAQATSQPSGT